LVRIEKDSSTVERSVIDTRRPYRLWTDQDS